MPPELARPWQLLLRAIDAGLIDSQDLINAINQLKRPDFGGSVWDEFRIEPRWGVDDELTVSLLDESCDCSRSAFIALLESLSETR
ncbi:hypothetical protein FE236_00410 [Mariprofundus erugo]|uniref:hypothetical protein n=1 Tax=Mariprofundus erugo TaxID=2528639 RepID=UPI0010FEE7CF|nr:hypothetical protein [Mariprofundus erugo]TLS78256.1 hypothetical protein FE236_00410 [Mariprofundus erugo]